MRAAPHGPDLEAGTAGTHVTGHSGIPYGWNDAQPARIGVMPRGP
uniref:Uncharacterized protein n=1 Tax=Streptomyces sp. NBC_00049 TaxID=2903617 RepID=A0AAU2K189_9ACTN